MNYTGVDRGKFLDYTSSNDFALYEIGFYKCEPNYSYGPIMRAHTIFHYVISGRGYLILDEKRFEIKSGEGFIIPAGVKAYYEADAIDPWEYTWIHVDGPKASEVFRRAGLNESAPVFSPTGDACAIVEIINKIYDNSERELYCQGKVYEFFDCLLQNVNTNSRESESSGTTYINNAIRFINLKYSEPIGVEEIAQACGLNRSYFTRIFRQITGTTPQTYLLEFRMKKAIEYLNTTEESINNIAFLVGYNDLFTFSKAFKRYTGLSPRDYRNNLVD